MNPAVRIRPASDSDLQAILGIYNDAVQNTTAIWNETLVDLPDREAWFAERRAKNFPVVVAEKDGEVIGYATYGLWRAVEGFRYTMEHSVYVRSDRKGKGRRSNAYGGPRRDSEGARRSRPDRLYRSRKLCLPACTRGWVFGLLDGSLRLVRNSDAGST